MEEPREGIVAFKERRDLTAVGFSNEACGWTIL